MRPTKEPSRDQIPAEDSNTTAYNATNGGKIMDGSSRGRGDGGSFDSFRRRLHKEQWRASSSKVSINPTSLPTSSVPPRLFEPPVGRVKSPTPIRQLALPKDFPPPPFRAAAANLAPTQATAPSGQSSTFIPHLYEGPSEPAVPAPSFPYAPLAPPGWRVHWSGRYKQWYYRDILSGQSQWVPPSYK
ncbi:hypothetical protein F53441_9284 [Fusarium austroafricanum]|uniref:WW domain-containing protein n=1 Tax=Fusarium austroafricanum TaxID=2364996 RepID=A0A8H4KC38_9HYPO|nr:hypothetical protein F53441_9284 [Fusarium austroafricanum]